MRSRASERATGSRRRRVAIGSMAMTAAALALGLPACGSDSDDTITLSEWVDKFDQLCVSTAGELSDPDLTDEEFRDISDRALAEMRALSAPDEMADTATELLDAIEAGTAPDLDDGEIAAIDGRVLDSATALGVSDACIGGVPGQ